MGWQFNGVLLVTVATAETRNPSSDCAHFVNMLELNYTFLTYSHLMLECHFARLPLSLILKELSSFWRLLVELSRVRFVPWNTIQLLECFLRVGWIYSRVTILRLTKIFCLKEKYWENYPTYYIKQFMVTHWIYTYCKEHSKLLSRYLPLKFCASIYSNLFLQ